MLAGGAADWDSVSGVDAWPAAGGGVGGGVVAAGGSAPVGVGGGIVADGGAAGGGAGAGGVEGAELCGVTAGLSPEPSGSAPPSVESATSRCGPSEAASPGGGTAGAGGGAP